MPGVIRTYNWENSKGSVLNSNRPSLPLEWPSATPTTVIWLVVSILLTLLVVVVWEIYRRRAERGARIRAEWQAVEDIVREKDLPKENCELLRAFIRRWSASEPLRAVTVRQHFDECVELEMNLLSGRGDAAQFHDRGQALRDIRQHLGLDFVPFGQRIVSTRELHGGQLIWMARSGDAEAEWVRVSVVEVDEALFRVAPPDGVSSVISEAGAKIRCRMWREDDARYLFDVMLDHVEASPPGWAFRHTAQLERMQSRAHYRVPHDQTTTIGVLDGAVDGDTSSVKDRRVVTSLRGRIFSLSAGGLALTTHQPVPKQVLLRISLDLPGYELFEAEARIVSSSALAGGRWLIRASFVGVDDATRDVIAHYVLRRQQPLLRAEAELV